MEIDLCSLVMVKVDEGKERVEEEFKIIAMRDKVEF